MIAEGEAGVAAFAQTACRPKIDEERRLIDAAEGKE